MHLEDPDQVVEGPMASHVEPSMHTLVQKLSRKCDFRSAQVQRKFLSMAAKQMSTPLGHMDHLAPTWTNEDTTIQK